MLAINDETCAPAQYPPFVHELSVPNNSILRPNKQKKLGILLL